MSLKRIEIRQAIKDLLTNTTDVGSNVFANRIRPVWVPQLPCILIYTRSEAVEDWAEAPKEYKRTLEVEIQVRVEADDQCDDALDTIGAQIEAKLYEDHTLDELCHDVILRSAEMTINGEGDNEYGALTLIYEIIYHSQPVNDSENLPELNRIDVEYELIEGGTSAPEALDTLDGLSAL